MFRIISIVLTFQHKVEIKVDMKCIQRLKVYSNVCGENVDDNRMYIRDIIDWPLQKIISD